MAYDEATAVATHMGMQYVEVSSKTGTGVEDAFQIMTEKIAEKNACKNLDGRSMPIREMLWFRNSSESFVMHGASSWLNKLNINGLYIPETSNTFFADKILGTLGYYWFRNISTSTTTMVYRDKRWMICKRSKLLAFIECPEPFVFPYDSRLRKWREVYFSGALFDWSTSRHSMYISIEKENSKTIFGTGQRNKIVEKYSASENEEYIDIDKFLQCSKEPECIGFNISLFVRYCEVKLAVLAFEFNDSKEILDISLMESIQHKREVMESTCRELLATITPSPLELSVIELSYEDVLRALASLIEDATALFDHLTDMENGNFTMATKCRKTIQELKAHEVTLRDKLVAINVAELLHTTGASKGAGSDEVLNQLEDFLFNESNMGGKSSVSESNIVVDAVKHRKWRWALKESQTKWISIYVRENRTSEDIVEQCHLAVGYSQTTSSGYDATFGLSGDALGAQLGVELSLHLHWEMTSHKEIVQDREMKVGAGMKLTIEQEVVEGVVTLEKVPSHKSSLFFRLPVHIPGTSQQQRVREIPFRFKKDSLRFMSVKVDE
eukprot:gene30075-39270_t